MDDYYLELPPDQDDPYMLRNRAVAHENKGDRILQQGDLEGALHEYTESESIAENMVSSEPGNTDWLRNLFVARLKVGDVLKLQGDLAGALIKYQSAEEISARLVSFDISNADWMYDYATINMNIGDVLKEQGAIEDALQHYDLTLKTRELLSSIYINNTQWQRDVFIIHDRIGNLLLDQGDLDGALKAYQSSKQIIEHLEYSDPKNMIWKRDASIVHERIGTVLCLKGDFDNALASLETRLRVSEQLSSYDPSNADWQRDVFVAHLTIGDVLQQQDQFASALREFKTCMRIINGLVALDPNNTLWQWDKAGTHKRIGDVLNGLGDLQGATVEIRECIRISERYANSDTSSAKWQRTILLSYYEMASIYEKSGRADATEWWRKAYVQLSSMKQREILKPADEKYFKHLEQKLAGWKSTQASASDPKGIMGTTWGMTRAEVRRLRDSWPNDLIDYRETEHLISFGLIKVTFGTVSFGGALVFLGFEHGKLESCIIIIPVHENELSESPQWFMEIKEDMIVQYGPPFNDRVPTEDAMKEEVKKILKANKLEIKLASNWVLGKTRIDLTLMTVETTTGIWLRYARI